MKYEFDLLQTSDWCHDWQKDLSLLHWPSQCNYGLVLNCVLHGHLDRVHRDLDKISGIMSMLRLTKNVDDET
jgi:hypothetical protein